MPKHQRLKSARIRAGYKTAREAADKMGVPYGTYSGHESGSRGIKDDDLKKYAEFFNVTLAWLSFGQDKSNIESQQFIIVNGIIGRSEDFTINFIDEDKVESMPVKLFARSIFPTDSGTKKVRSLPMPFFMAPIISNHIQMNAIKVDGEYVIADWEEGSVMYFHHERYEDINGFNQAICILWLENGAATVGRSNIEKFGEHRIVAVSPMIATVTRVGMTIWLETLVQVFMDAAQRS